MTKKIFLLTALCCLLAANNLLAQNNVFFVKPNATGSGESWDDAIDLADALIVAQSGDEVWVAEGTYLPKYEPRYNSIPADKPRDVTFRLFEGVKVYGGFAGNETSIEERDWETNKTILSGNIGEEDEVTDNAYHVVLAVAISPATVLDGFTITGGYSDSETSGTIYINPYYISRADGAGIYSSSNTANEPSITINNVIISGNTAGRNGGGIRAVSVFTLSNITISGNTAGENGGGAHIGVSYAILTNVTISDNVATQNGGGIYNDGSPTLNNVKILNNTSNKSGGGMYNKNASPTLTNVVISNNESKEEGAGGGGICNFQSSAPTLTNVIISNNRAVSYGGGMYNSNGQYDTKKLAPTLINVTISDNTVNKYGGGMYNIYSSPTITNVTFSGNKTLNEFIDGSDGGGIFNNDKSSPIITNTTFTNNSAQNGGGMRNNNNSNPILTDVIFTNNTAYYSGGGMRNTGASPKFYNIVIKNNSAIYGGGVYNSSESSPTFYNTVIANNTANYGGGVSNNNSSSVFINSVFTNNYADARGGGIRNDNSTEYKVTLTNVTISKNEARDGGCGIHEETEDATTTMYNSIVIDNVKNNNPNIKGTVNYDASSIVGNDIDATAIFKDAANGDYTLKAGSAAHNTGNAEHYDTETYGNKDLAGNPRIAASAIDMGAYELPEPLAEATPQVIACTGGMSIVYDFSTCTSSDFPNFRAVDSIVVSGTWTNSQLEALGYSLKNSAEEAAVNAIKTVLKTADFSAATFSGDITSGMNYMFYNCAELTSLTLPESGSLATSVSLYRAFSACNSLQSINNLDKFSNISNLESAFEGCTELSELRLASVPANTAAIYYQYAFDGAKAGIKVYLYETTGITGTDELPEAWQGYTDEEVQWMFDETDPGQPTPVETGRAPSLHIYPNPATDGFYVQGIDNDVKTGQAPSLQISTLSGQTVWTQAVSNGEYIPVGTLPAGTYIVRTNTGYTGKLLIK